MNDIANFEVMTKMVSVNNALKLIPIEFSKFVFEERVSLNCFYCARYNKKWTCPPNIPKIDYRQTMAEYENLAILEYDKTFSDDQFDIIRTESTNDVHRTLLDLERFLYINNKSLAVSFIGGSCKLCKNGCGKDACNNPGQARIPLEATGVNVIKTLANIGIKIEFPIKNVFHRYGLIAW